MKAFHTELSGFLEVLTIKSYFINSSSKNVFRSIGINPDKYALYGFTLRPEYYSINAGNALMGEFYSHT